MSVVLYGKYIERFLSRWIDSGMRPIGTRLVCFMERDYASFCFGNKLGIPALLKKDPVVAYNKILRFCRRFDSLFNKDDGTIMYP